MANHPEHEQQVVLGILDDKDAQRLRLGCWRFFAGHVAGLAPVVACHIRGGGPWFSSSQ
jgi:hypothetical protein